MSLLAALGLKPLRPQPQNALAEAGSTVTATVAAKPPAPPGTTSPPAPPTPPASPTLAEAGADATATVSAGPPTPGPAVDKNKIAFDTARAAIQKLVDDLDKHAQKARIATPIANAKAKMTAADGHAGKSEWSEAAKRLAEAKTICADAKKLADEWVAYMTHRAAAKALGYSVNDPARPIIATVDGIVAAADALAGATPPNFAGAKKKLDDDITKILKPGLESMLKTAKARLASVLKASASAQAFAKKDIDEGKARIDTAEKAFAAGEWSLCRTNVTFAVRVLSPALRMVERRGPYDAQRAKTVAAIDALKSSAALKDKATALEPVLKQADALAAFDARKFEEGSKLLQDAAAKAAAWKKLEGEVDAAAKARAAAKADLDALDKHAAAAKVATQREAVRKLLAAADSAWNLADLAPDPTANWPIVANHSARAKADAAAAKKLADSFGATSAAQDAAAKPADAAGLKTALDKLVADGAQAKKAPHADQAKAELERFTAQSTGAAAALKVPDNAKAAKALGEAAAALEAAKKIQAAHAQFKGELTAVEAALKALQASPRAAKIKSKVDPIAAALTQAKDKDKAHDGAAALQALRRASDLVRDAKTADADRAAFERDSADIAKTVKATKDAAEKTALEKMVADAEKQADAMKFADAGKSLKQVLVRIDKAKLDAKITANPADPEIAKIANKMVENGGADTVDKMIAALPGGNDTRAIAALAEGRYGTKFKSGPALAGGNQVQAMQAICAMFATVPDDVRKNTSITGVSHTDAIGTSAVPRVGGAHNFDNGEITLGGRPSVGSRALGTALTSVDPISLASVKQLPSTIDTKCLPKDAGTVELLSWVAAHEVGHGMDDKRGFMATHESDAKYGGWVRFGASVQPLADIIGADARFKEYYKTPEQRQYILDRLMSKPPNPPAAAAGSAAAAARTAFDTWFTTATSPGVFERQADSDSLKIGKLIYHEAYTRDWVGYLAEARNQGLTGYQFRAPAEWFAELYAGYRSGKLKDTHPAMDWLKKL